VDPSRSDRHPISAAATAAIACCALVLASGCGSSGVTGTSTGSPTTATSAASGLKPTTAPRYASPPASAPVQSGVVQIAYRNIAIAPDTVRVRAGSTVRWTNDDSAEHNVTSDGGPTHFASGNFGEGRSFEVKLARPGVVHYLCTIHPTTMNGTIEVVR
jgi:plastocyanin